MSRVSLADTAARLGLPVFPCAADKKPTVKGWPERASADPRAIAAMFGDAPMIGVPTGPRSGVVVVDVDIKAGANGRAWLDAERGRLPSTRTHRTRSGGLHLVFRSPDVPIRNSASRVAPGVDVRGDGGYVVWPPSPGYAVADPAEPADMPDWLVAACLPPERPKPPPAPVAPPTDRRRDGGTPYGLAALKGACDDIRSAPDGAKHDTLVRRAHAVGGLVSAGEVDRAVAIADLREALASIADRCADLDAARKTLAECFAHGEAEPRHPPPLPPRIRHEVIPPEPPPHPEPVGEPWQPDAAPPGAAGPASAADAPGVPLLPLTWFENLQPCLDASDFVQGLLTTASAVVAYGESNAGKTFWVTDLALHVAAGMPWRGLRVEGGPVIYCALEGGIGFRNRVAVFRTAHGLEDARIPFAAIQTPINLLDPNADTPRLVATLRDLAACAGEPVRLVVVDTLSRALAGGNENAPEDMGALVKNMDAIRAETGACVLFIHHSGKDAAKGARGHSLLRAAVDTEIEVTVDEETGRREARVVKQREMAKGQRHGFTLEVVTLGTNRHGEDVTSCVVRAADGEGSGARDASSRPLTGDQRAAWRILCDLVAHQGRPDLPGAPPGVLSVPVKWWRERYYERVRVGDTEEARKKAFQRASNSLQQMGYVATDAGRVWPIHQRDNRDNRDIVPCPGSGTNGTHPYTGVPVVPFDTDPGGPGK